MELFKRLLFCCIFAVTCVKAQSDCTGAEVGELPNLAHGIGGTLYVENATSFCIQNFFYDGFGPDAFLYFFYPGHEVRDQCGGVIIPIQNNMREGQFRVGRDYAFNNETFRFTLPQYEYSACDFGNFTIWCRYATQLFTQIEIPAEIFADNGGSIACDKTPGRFVGVVPNLDHGLGGLFYIQDNKTVVIKSFTYDGEGPDVFIYWFPPGVEASELADGGGNTIPYAGSDRPSNQIPWEAWDGTTDQNFTISNDMDVYTCDIGNWTLWCRIYAVFFTRVPFDNADTIFTNNPREQACEPNLILCDRPTTRPGVYVGELPTESNRLSGAFYVRDEYTFFIQLFNYDAEGEATFLYYYPVGEEVQDNGGGNKINISNTQDRFQTGKLNSFSNLDFTVNLRLADGGPVKACDIGYFTVWDEELQQHFTMIKIPQDIFTTDESEAADGSKILCGEPGDGAVPSVAVVSYLMSVFFVLTALLFEAY